MMYLENLLETMDSKADVIVTLSSSTTYGIGQIENPITIIDGCGNHHTENWLNAITKKHLEKVFVVVDVKVTFESYMDKPQWEIFLQNEKSYTTEVLACESNSQAIQSCFFR